MRWRRETIGKTTNRLHNSKDLDFRKVERINVPRYVYFLTSFVSGVGGKKTIETHTCSEITSFLLCFSFFLWRWFWINVNRVRYDRTDTNHQSGIFFYDGPT
jgi:hypothetical protein